MKRQTLLNYAFATSAILSAALLSVPTLLQAATAETDPVGFNKIVCPGDSDTYVNIAFHRSASYQTVVDSVVGAVVNVSTTPSSPNWDPNVFVYSAGVQPNHYYLAVIEGTKEGRYYDITANGAASLTVDLAGDTLEGQLAQGTSIKIIPHWTLDTLMKDGAGVNASASHNALARQSEILIPDTVTPGKDLAASVSYYYFSGTSGAGPGWRKAGVAGSLADDDILPPGLPIVVRHNISTGTTIYPLGDVQWFGATTFINVVENDTDQDNPVTLPVPVPFSLAQSKLWESGAFAGSASHNALSRGDEVLVFDNAEVNIDKAAAYSYYYFTGTSGAGPGWRKAGVAGTLANDDIVFDGNKGIVIRKKGSAGAGTSVWSVQASYLQPAP